MFDRESPANFIHDSSKQDELIIFRLPDDLEEIAGRISVAKFKRIKRHTGSEQVSAEVEFMEFSTAIVSAIGSKAACSNPSSPFAFAISALKQRLHSRRYPFSIEPKCTTS